MTPPQPLVPPGPPLSRRDTIRYARHLSLPHIGETGQRRLRNAKVLVIGAGGLGSPILLYLAAAGVGTIGVIDDDLVELGNLQRQVIHRRESLGTAKVDSARAAILALDETVTVRTHHQRLTADNAVPLVGEYHLVLDGTDNFATRYLASDAAEVTGTPLVWGTVYRFAAQVSVFWAGQGPTLRDLYPQMPEPGTVLSCADGGVLGALCGVIGSIMAAEAIKVLTGVGEPLLGRVLLYDALALTSRTVPLLPDPDRPPVTAPATARRVGDTESGAAAAAVTGGAGDGAGLIEVDPAEAVRLVGTAGDRVLLVDVREPYERDIVRIPGDHHVPLAAIVQDGWAGVRDHLRIPQQTEQLILYCKAGIRSAAAVRRLVEQAEPGTPQPVNLAGGVLAWVRDVAPDNREY